MTMKFQKLSFGAIAATTFIFATALGASAQQVRSGFTFSNSTTTLDVVTVDVISNVTSTSSCAACRDTFTETATANASGFSTATANALYDFALNDDPTSDVTAEGNPDQNLQVSATYASDEVVGADFDFSSTTDTTVAQSGSSVTTSFGGSVFGGF